MISTVSYGLGFALLGTALVFAYRFYGEFFVPDGHPVEWEALYGGLGSLASYFLFSAGYGVWAEKVLLQVAVLSLLASALFLVISGYLLWQKFRV